MNLEELKLVTDTIQQLGDHGTTAFIWWIVFDKLIPAVLWAVGSGVFMYLCWRVVQVCVMANRAVESVERMRNMFGLGSGLLIDREVDDVERTVQELHRKENGHAR